MTPVLQTPISLTQLPRGTERRSARHAMSFWLAAGMFRYKGTKDPQWMTFLQVRLSLQTGTVACVKVFSAGLTLRWKSASVVVMVLWWLETTYGCVKDQRIDEI